MTGKFHKPYSMASSRSFFISLKLIVTESFFLLKQQQMKPYLSLYLQERLHYPLLLFEFYQSHAEKNSSILLQEPYKAISSE